MRGGRGTQLDDEQKKKFFEGAESRATAKEREGDPVITLVNSKHGLWIDELNDVAQIHIDLFVGSLFAEGPTADLQIAINLAGVHPDGTNINSDFEVFFNTDNNSGTGSTLGSFSGIDKILRISIQGRFPFTTPAGSITADLLDVESSTLFPLISGKVERVIGIVDADLPDLPSALEYGDSIRQSVPLSLFVALANQVPIGIRATNLDTGEFDEASFVFEFNPPPQPFVEMSPLNGEVGTAVNLEGTNFSPSSLITIFVDAIETQTTTALSDGSFSTSFNFPTEAIVCDTNFDGEVSSDDINAILAAHGTTVDHFMTARDVTGRFDFSVFKRRVAVDDAHICALQCTTPGCAAEISITKGDSPDPVGVGGELTYRLRIRNLGPSDATGVVVTDTLPANVNFVSASSGCSRSGTTVTCKIGNMGDGESAVRVIRVRPTSPGKLSNTATVRANETDPRPGNNTAITVTTVR